MTQGDAPQTLQLVLSDEDSAGRICVEVEAFVRFNLRIEEELAALITKWRTGRPAILQRSPGKRSRNRP